MNVETFRVGILIASDRASRGEYPDRGGPAISDWLSRAVTSQWDASTVVVADDRDEISAALRGLTDQAKCHLILTSGGTGPAASDVTPEATLDVVDKILPGFGEQMRAISLAYVPTAILSRQTAGIRGSTLIVNLPGQPKAIGEILGELFAAIPYCIELLGGPVILTDSDVVCAFRPSSAPPLKL
jgi:molybdopterin adenylyltransferase